MYSLRASSKPHPGKRDISECPQPHFSRLTIDSVTYYVIRMARPTTDPKPLVLTLRLSKEDLRTLSRLARQRKCSRGEVLRQLLRTEVERQG